MEVSRVMAVTLNLLAESSDFRIGDPTFPEAFATLVRHSIEGLKGVIRQRWRYS